MRRFRATIGVALIGTTSVAAQESKAPTPTAGAVHGIIRKAPIKPPQSEVKDVNVAPAASAEAVVAAVAAAVKSMDADPKAAPPQPREPRPRPATAPRRRYVVTWPSRRVEVQWSAPDERVTLDWPQVVGH